MTELERAGDGPDGRRRNPVATMTRLAGNGRVPPITEKAFMRQVLELAQYCGWHCYHPTLSKWSERGWPDLAMVRPPRLLLAELKSERGKVSPEQQTWLAELGACPGVEVYCWRPADLEGVAKILRGVG